MDYQICALIVAILLSNIFIVWSTLTSRRGNDQGQLPRGPTRWPVVGNIPQLTTTLWSPHRSFAKLAQTYGPIMTLWLGSMCTIVISSDEAAREMFKNHDAVLAGRKVYEAMKDDKFSSEGSIIVAQYGPFWRMLRRLCTAEFFVTSRLEAMREVRARCIDQMVRFIEEASENGTKAVDVNKFFFLMNLNVIGNLIFSKDLLDPKSEKGTKFFYHAGKIIEILGKPNVADYFPIFKWFDLQGIKKRARVHTDIAFEIAKEFVRERTMENMEENGGDYRKNNKDYLDVLLEFRGDGVEEPSKFSSSAINIFIFEMFVAGTETTTSTLEWAMVELLRNRKELTKVQSEIRNTIGPDSKLEEKQVENLPYLKAVIKETLRLHPPLPFLVPHKAMEHCKMLGFFIPKETQILVNAWAIGRDPKVWKDPTTFRPERFLEQNLDYKGHNFEFIPFGSGRRMCPGMPLASRLLALALGSVLYNFDWVLPDGVTAEEIDMGEEIGITLKKSVALKAIPVPYKPN